MVDAHVLSTLLETLYRAPFEPACWQTFLEQLCSVTGSRGVYLIGADRDRSLAVHVQGGLVADEATLARYESRLAPADPYRAAIVRTGRTGYFTSEEMLPHEEYLRSDLYRLQNRHLDLVYGSTLVLQCTLRGLDVIAFWRSARQGPMPEEHHELFHMLEPHVRAALQVRKKLGAIAERMSGVTAMSRASQTPTFLVTPRGRVLEKNAAAVLLLQQQHLLLIEADCLTVASKQGASLLARALNGVARPLERAGTRVYPLTLRDSNLDAVQHLLIVRLHGPVQRGGQLLVLATSARCHPRLPPDVLRAFYGFTRAESEVADGLLTGFTLEEIARLRKTTLSTARQQVKSMCAKTESRGQAGLLQKLISVPSLPSAFPSETNDSTLLP